MMADREKIDREKENDNIEDKHTSEEEPSMFDEDLTEKEIAEEDVEEVEEEEVDLRDKVDMLEDKLLRLAAEYDNYKKRQKKEFSRMVKHEIASFYRDFLPIFENIRRAYEVDAISEEAQRICDGICLIYNDLHKLLNQRGIHKMDIEPGDKFNSEIMEAVCTQETDEYNSDVVLEVIETGYMYEDILLRPAKVMVSC